jgi:hypothetical protein
MKIHPQIILKIGKKYKDNDETRVYIVREIINLKKDEVHYKFFIDGIYKRKNMLSKTYFIDMVQQGAYKLVK